MVCCCCSLAKLCPTICDFMDCSTLSFSILHYLPTFAQIHVHWICNAIYPPHSMWTPSPPAHNLPALGSFQMSRLSTSGGRNIGASASASVIPMYIQSWFPLALTGLISLLSKKLSRVFSSTTIWKHQFFSAQPSLWSYSHICTWLLKKKKPIALTTGPWSTKWCLCITICCWGFS